MALSFCFASLTHAGIARQPKPNEDSLFAVSSGQRSPQGVQRFGLFLVADGMGGHAKGQDASRLAIKTMTERLMPHLLSTEAFTDEGYLSLLVEGVQAANAAVHTRNREQRADMGTTMTAALVVGMTAFVANVGDSRTYLYRESEGLRKVTNDHSVVASLVEAGIIKPDDIATHPKRNQIYRSLGEKPVIDVDSFKVPLQPVDILLLCSDGLWDMVRDPDIQQVLRTASTPQHAAEELIQAALDGGGEDNVSVIVVHLLGAVSDTVVAAPHRPTPLLPPLLHVIGASCPSPDMAPTTSLSALVLTLFGLWTLLSHAFHAVHRSLHQDTRLLHLCRIGWFVLVALELVETWCAVLLLHK